MPQSTIIFVAIVLIVLVYIIVIYNRFIRWQNLVEEAWSGIDVQLKRRHNLIPNIVETVKGYSKHERELFEDIVKIRNNVDEASNVNERGESENALSKSIRNLFAVAESYPDLKANQNFLALQDELTGTENRVAVARGRYNRNVGAYNSAIRSFPGNIIAANHGFKESTAYFKAAEQAREAPKVEF